MKNYRYLLLMLFGASFTFNRVNAAHDGPMDELNQQDSSFYNDDGMTLFPDLPILTEQDLSNILFDAGDPATQQPEPSATPSPTVDEPQIDVSNPPVKTFKCPHCDASFGKNCHLINHIRKHTGEKPFACSKCNMTFAEKSSLKNHARTHEKNKVRSFQCTQCPKSFFSKKVFENHLQNHLIKKPKLPCAMCSKTFINNSNLTRHVQDIHSLKSNQITCPTCNKSFKKQEYLKEHLNIHTGTFRCEPCNLNFARKNKLDTHLDSARHLTQLAMVQNLSS